MHGDSLLFHITNNSDLIITSVGSKQKLLTEGGC